MSDKTADVLPKIKPPPTWDNQLVPSFSLDDLDDKILDKFKLKAQKKRLLEQSVLNKSKEKLLERLQLKKESGLTRASMLLFSDKPQKWQKGAFFKINYFKEDPGQLFCEEIYGSLFECVDKVIERVFVKFMKTCISYEGVQRIERYFVPVAAFREALLNAICNNQYQKGEAIEICVNETSLYVTYCSGFPENGATENLTGEHS